MNDERVYKIFNAHAWIYNEEYYRVFRYLNEIRDFKYQDTGNVDIWRYGEEKPPQEEMHKQILPAEVILLISDVYAESEDKWIPYIINEAKSLAIPIIAIDSWGPQTISHKIVEKAVEVVEWDAAKMVDAIRRYSK